MTIETSFIFIISLILLWIKPGPGQAMIITRALNDGFWPAFFIALGAMIGGAVYFVIAILGVQIIEDNTSVIAVLLKLLGAGYLFYLGYDGLRNIDSGQWAGRTDSHKSNNLLKNFMAGLLIELSNPLTIFYFLGLMPTLMPMSDVDTMGTVIGVCLIVYGGMVFYSIVIALAVKVRNSLSNTSFVRRINLFSSIGFICIAGFLLFSALTQYDGVFAL